MQLGGHDADSKGWKRARAKAYPPDMGRILVEGHVRFANAQKGEGYEDDPEGLLERLQVLSYSYDTYKEDAKGTTMCADYFSSKPHADGVGT